MENIFVILVGSVLVNNFIMSRFLGICPFLGVSRQIGAAVGMGMAVTFVMGLTSALTWCADRYILVPLGAAKSMPLWCSLPPPPMALARQPKGEDRRPGIGCLVG